MNHKKNNLSQCKKNIPYTPDNILLKLFIFKIITNDLDFMWTSLRNEISLRRNIIKFLFHRKLANLKRRNSNKSNDIRLHEARLRNSEYY